MNNETLLDRFRASLNYPTRKTAIATTDPLNEEKLRTTVSQMARSRISATLRQLRGARGLSYDAVRERTGLSQQLLYEVEYGSRRLTLSELMLLAECYGVSADDILGVDLENG